MKGLKIVSGRFTVKNNLFVKIFSGLILMSLTMVLFLGFWMNNISSQNYRKQAAMLNLTRLRQADESMELIIDVLSQSMAQMMWSNDFITYMVCPTKVAPERDYRISRQIKSMGSGSELVLRAFLYSPLAGEIYDSDSIFLAEEYSDWPVLQEHLARMAEKEGKNGESGKETRKTGTMTMTAVSSFGGRLYVIQDLNIAEHIGTLVYEVNVRALIETVGLEGGAEAPEIFVFNKNGEPVFGRTFSYDGIAPEWEAENSFINQDNVAELGGRQTRGFYRYDSPDTGRIYLMPLDTKKLSVRFRDILPMYLMAAVVFLALSIIFDFYISNSIYRPINRLMKLVTQVDGREKQSGDTEIDFLEGAYSDALDQQCQLKGVIASIAPEILDSMLKNLLVGKTLEEQRVAEILEGVGNPVQIHDRYLVLICQLNEPEERKVTDVELNLHLLSIRKVVEGAGMPDYHLYDIRTEKLVVAVIMAFPPEYPVVGIKRECAKLSQLLKQMGEKIPYGLQTERGSIYQNIMDIRYAYKEALGKLQYQQYLESSEDIEEESAQDENQIVNRRYFQERTKALAEQAAQGNKAETENLIVQVLADMKRDVPGVGEFREMAGIFLDELTERVITLPLNEEDQELLESTHAVTELADLTTREELSSRVLRNARIAAGLFHTYNKKNSYKYVKLAKEYIDQNYADSNLSLNDVCEHIGISASYLSELFNEISGEKFSTYLASFRVEKAKRLLRTTNVTIKEIGFCCGFNSIQNFIRVFKKYTDQTPGNYREEQA